MYKKYVMLFCKVNTLNYPAILAVPTTVNPTIVKYGIPSESGYECLDKADVGFASTL